jgi:cytochrome P450
MKFSASIPRFVNLPELRANPLSFLQAAKSAADGLVVISEEGPIFSRAQNCSVAVAVFGPVGVRDVLNDTDVFGTVVSVGELFSLPPKLMRLNAGLFSMRGERHRSRQQMLRSLLGADGVREHGETIAQGWESFAKDLQPGRDIFLLSEMRRLVLHVSERIVFGDAELALGKLIQSYFDCRRSLSGGQVPAGPAARRELIRMGGTLDRMLCARLAAFQEDPASAAASRCLLARLARLETSGDQRLTDDELIAHANVLFMSSSEPVAVALTWTLLLLSQQPELRQALRQELTAACDANNVPVHIDEVDFPLLKAVIQESLRLLPPNAIMVRLTTRPGCVLGYELPASCEVVLSPYVAHRDPHEFAEPDAFDPHRWRNLKPSTYSYFPFGIGARYCLGRQLASFTLLSILARIISRYDVVLASDQELDWTINITMMPASEPVVRFLSLTALREAHSGGRLGGPVAALVRFSSPGSQTARQYRV